MSKRTRRKSSMRADVPDGWWGSAFPGKDTRIARRIERRIRQRRARQEAQDER